MSSSRHQSAITEAITSLGYLRPEAAPQLAELLARCTGGAREHPRSVATAYRKAGEQLSAGEKKAAGVRANAHLSRQAYADLTEKGQTNPLAAHEITILRASYTILRQSSYDQCVSACAEIGEDSFIFVDGMFTGTCAGCSRLNNTMVTTPISGVPPDCEREACGLMYRVKVDFIGQLVRREKAQKQTFLGRLLDRFR